jgi:hypothetical protein
MTIVEQWKPVVGYEGFYEVSNLGRVKSLDRVCHDKNGLAKRFKGRFLTCTVKADTHSKYLVVKLGSVYGQSSKTRYVAHLVLEAFERPRPDGMECCHCDGNSLNNQFSNLRWDTPQKNTLDKYKHGTILWGSKNHQAQLKEDQVLEIRAKYVRYSRYKSNSKELADEYGVNIQVIGKIVRRERWKHVA